MEFYQFQERGGEREKKKCYCPYLNIAVDAEEDEEVVGLGLCLVQVGDEEDAARAGGAQPRQADTSRGQGLVNIQSAIQHDVFE